MVISALDLSIRTKLSQIRTISTVYGKYAFAVAGHGKPTVVLEAGLGDSMGTWSLIFRDIEALSQVFTYNRAGYRKSHSENGQRDGYTIVLELRTLLKEINIPPPYLLVGHSLGGTFMELYARTHPNEVFGVVFIDARHADFTRRCKEARVRISEPPAIHTALLPPGAKRELKAEPLTMRQIDESPPFPKIPIVVLTGMNKPSEGEKFGEVWLSTQKDLAVLSPISRHFIYHTCSHYVHHENTVGVIDAIRWVIKTGNSKQFVIQDMQDKESKES
jgi:pimeloyl-ACP methyl ester carboxylesterase